VLADVVVQPINRSVIFLKEKDITLTNGAWRIAIDVDMSPYEEAVATVKTDITSLEGHRKKWVSNSEMHQISALLNTLEVRLYNFQQLLPRLDRRRGLINFGGSILKSLFGTATVEDIHLLHETLEGLRSTTSDVVHSLNSQLTYVKNLGTVTSVNTMAIANLSSIVKDIAIRSHENFQRVTQDVIWLNATLHNYSEFYTIIRQLESALLQLIHQFDELLGAIQCVLQGKLPIGLINPTTLQGILRNISLQLPEGYELIVGTKTDKIYMYYELVQVSVIGDAHSIKLFINVPLRTANSQFTLYKVVALPTRVAETKFVAYSIEYSYFGLESNRHDYVLLKETDLLNCVTSKVTVCPANMAVYSAKTLTCLASIYFQTPNHNSLCRRHLLLNHRTPTLQKHQSLWLYYFPEPRQATLRCLKNNTWTTHTEVLSEAGVILNATTCSIATEDIRTFPELHGSTQTSLEAPHFYIPDNVLAVAAHEIPLLEQMTPREIQQIDEVRSKVMAPSQTYDVDSLLNLRQVSFRQEQRTYWHMILTTTVGIIAVLAVLCYSLRSIIHRHIVCRHSTKTPVEPSTVTPNPLQITPEPSQRTHLPKCDNPQQDVSFVHYSLTPTE